VRTHIALVRVNDSKLLPTRVVVWDDIPPDIQRVLIERAATTAARSLPIHFTHQENPHEHRVRR
jgi:hypothetical protein